MASRLFEGRKADEAARHHQAADIIFESQVGNPGCWCGDGAAMFSAVDVFRVHRLDHSGPVTNMYDESLTMKMKSVSRAL